MRADTKSMKLVGARPDGSGFFKVCMPYDTPDGTYQRPGVKIVVRTASGWSVWRYVSTILQTVIWPRVPRVGNLFLVGAGLWRLTSFPGTRRLRDWAINRGVALSGYEQTYPCLCANCIGRQVSSGSPGCRGGTREVRDPAAPSTSSS